MQRGKREREARKRHRRALCWSGSMGSGGTPLKLGRVHFRRWIKPIMADSRKTRGERALESARRSPPNLRCRDDEE